MKQQDLQSELSVEDTTECLLENREPRSAKQYQIRVVDQNFEPKMVLIADPTPTGRQILEASDFSPANDYILLMKQNTGMLEEVNLSEVVDVYHRGVEQFIAFESDRVFYFELNGKRYPWGAENISEKALRAIGNIPPKQALWLEQKQAADLLLDTDANLNLSASGLEKVYSAKRSWRLNVQGVQIVSDEPTIVASDAMIAAGFNPADDWMLFLKVKGEPKKPIGVDYVIDLTTPGIEKLRMTPAEIRNGEKALCVKSDFSLLEKDTDYLNKLGFEWETLIDNGRRWLIIRNYTLPSGYNHEKVDIAIDIPAAYPGAALDMFYCFPALRLESGAVIAQTSCHMSIVGQSYQRWSRHLNGKTKWNPLTDSVMTQMAVIEECILREVAK
ncbi:multiubiquitin domain-containing protein [Vibrio fujianensis]|uniref:multiubiquitin domain-containing protein n=1 Tax=Vibrio fujianensis TaxID=1974215 RepID=UPI000C16808E|nr:multiubiquitin domain-containing protein [Vibrio fujianensis]